MLKMVVYIILVATVCMGPQTYLLTTEDLPVLTPIIALAQRVEVAF